MHNFIIYFMFPSLRNTCQVDRTRFFFVQTGKENTRMRTKIVIYFVNDEKVMQKQGVLNFDHKDQQSTCRKPPVTNNPISIHRTTLVVGYHVYNIFFFLKICKFAPHSINFIAPIHELFD